MSDKKINFPILDICTLSETRDEDFLVSKFGAYLERHKNLHHAHRHSFYHLVFFTQGAGFHTIDFSNFDVKPYQIYFMIPGQVHSWSFEGPIDGYVVNFSEEFFQSFLLKAEYLANFSFFNNIAQDSVINLSFPLNQKVKGFFEEILEQAQQKQPFAHDMIKSLLIQMFIAIDQQTITEKPKNIPQFNYTLLKNFQKLIEKHHTTLKLPMEYAELLYITPNHLNALCKEHLGMQAGEVIRNRIVLEAKRLLVNKNTSISEIAYYLNFADNSYFSKFFKKHVGVSPEEFRKKYLVALL
jgi:AraC-like DNA-binding protein